MNSTAWGAFLLVWTVRSILICGIAGLSSWVLRKQSAALKHLIWVCAFCGIGLAAFTAPFAAKVAGLPSLANEQVAVATESVQPALIVKGSELQPTAPSGLPAKALPKDIAPTNSKKEPVAAVSGSSEAPWMKAWALVRNQLSQWLTPPKSETAVPKVVASPDPTPVRNWGPQLQVALDIWIAVSAFLALALIGGLARLELVWRLSVRIRSRLGSEPEVRRSVDSWPGTALTWRAWRPAILYPKASQEWPMTVEQAIYLHEMAHIRRKDFLFHSLSNLICVVQWWNPAVWVARSQMRKLAEQAADDEVLAGGISAAGYAECLVQLAARLNKSGQRFHPGVTMIEKNKLTQRVQAILATTDSRNRVTLKSSVLAAALASLAVFPLTMITIDGGGATPVVSPTRLAQFETSVSATGKNFQVGTASTIAFSATAQDSQKKAQEEDLQVAIDKLIEQIQEMVTQSLKAKGDGASADSVIDKGAFKDALKKVIDESIKMSMEGQKGMRGFDGAIRFAPSPGAEAKSDDFVGVSSAQPAAPGAPPMPARGEAHSLTLKVQDDEDQPKGTATADGKTFTIVGQKGEQAFAADSDGVGSIDSEVAAALEKAFKELNQAGNGLTDEQRKSVMDALGQAMKESASAGVTARAYKIRAMAGRRGGGAFTISPDVQNQDIERQVKIAMGQMKMAQAQANDARKVRIKLFRGQKPGIENKVRVFYVRSDAGIQKAESKLKAAIAKLSSSHQSRLANATTIAQLKSALKSLQQSHRK